MSTVEQDVQQVVARYGLALDTHDHDALSALHGEEAQWAFSLGGQVVLGPFNGRDAILDFAAAAAVDEATQERHLLTNVVVTPESTSTSSAVAYLTLISIRHSAPVVAATAVARFHLKASDTAWLITDLHITFDNPPVPAGP